MKPHVMEKVKTLKITKWTLSKDIQVRKINMGTIKDPKYFKLNVDLKGTIATTAKGLLQEFKDVFAWNYKELKGFPFPPHIVEHKIEFDTIIPPSHQAHYRMNPNYATIIKQDLDKLLAIGFIELVQ